MHKAKCWGYRDEETRYVRKKSSQSNTKRESSKKINIEKTLFINALRWIIQNHAGEF